MTIEITLSPYAVIYCLSQTHESKKIIQNIPKVILSTELTKISSNIAFKVMFKCYFMAFLFENFTINHFESFLYRFLLFFARASHGWKVLIWRLMYKIFVYFKLCFFFSKEWSLVLLSCIFRGSSSKGFDLRKCSVRWELSNGFVLILTKCLY